MLSISLISASYLMDESKNTANDNLNVNSVNVNNVNVAELSVTDVIAASKQVKSYENENGRLPANVEIAGENYTMEQFLYGLCKVVANVNSSNNSSSIQVLKDVESAYSKGNNTKGELDRKAYISASKAIISFMDSNKQAPNFLKSDKLGDISFDATVDGFARIVNYMSENNNTLPDSVAFEADSLVGTNVASPSSSSSSSTISSSSSSSSNTYSSKSYGGNGWDTINSLENRLSGMTYGIDGDCYSFSNLVYSALSAAGYKCGIYQGYTEMGNHRVPYVYVDGTFYWLETCRVVQGGWGCGTSWTVPYDSWVSEYVYVSN